MEQEQHLRRRDPDLWDRMTPGERAAYESGWVDCAALTSDLRPALREVRVSPPSSGIPTAGFIP